VHGLEVEKLVRIAIFLEGVEELGLRDEHGASERYLHEMVFCDGIVDVEVLKKEVEKVKKYIAYVKSLLKSDQCITLSTKTVA
jgi:hypothetical protein